MRAFKQLSKTTRIAVGALVGVVVLAVASVAVPVSAETVEIPIGDIVAQGPDGSTQQIGSANIDEALVGRTCEVLVEVKNQVSVHPANKLVVSSGGTQVEVPGVEAEVDGLTTTAGTLTLGPTIEVSVVLGPSEISSLASNLTVTCTPLPVTPPPPPVKGDPPYAG